VSPSPSSPSPSSPSPSSPSPSSPSPSSPSASPTPSSSSGPRATGGSQASPLVEALGLQPHPEGGWFRETWRSEVSLRPDGYPGERSSATAIYFLLGPGEQSRWHVVRSAEIWLWHSGSPLHLQLGGSGDSPSSEPTTLTLGQDVTSGHTPQAIVPPGIWQAARPVDQKGETLVSCIVSPGFDFADFRLLEED
jgi:predicted cupin superfamily sugar epimerase